jgi:hypothetical protein
MSTEFTFAEELRAAYKKARMEKNKQANAFFDKEIKAKLIKAASEGKKGCYIKGGFFGYKEEKLVDVSGILRVHRLFASFKGNDLYIYGWENPW